MKMRFLAIFLWAAVSCCGAQINLGASSNTISITGDAEIKVVPDRANVYLGVETRNKDIAAASAQNDAGVRQVIAAIRRVGVDSTDIQTDFYHV